MMILWTRLLWVAENMAESSSTTTAPVASSSLSEVRSFYSKSYSTPSSVNVRDCVKDDAQIALLDLILILDDSTGNYQEMMFIPPDYNWINLNHPFISFRPQSRNFTLRSSLLVSFIALVKQNILKAFRKVLKFHKPVVTH